MICRIINIGVLTIATVAAGIVGQHASVAATTDATTAHQQVEVAGASARTTVAARITGRARTAINTSSRAAVNRAYATQFAPYRGLDTGYNASGCRIGSQSAASRAGTLKSINFFRALAGLQPVTLSSTLNQRSQATAVLVAANKRLSHYPTRGWRCYNTTAAKNAARANLALAYPRLTSGEGVALYMSEPGSNNTAVGHRRWVLNPETTTMGSGATRISHALTVVGPTRAGRANPSYIGWPTAGHFPNAIEPYGRWSLSAGDPGTDFRTARVQVSRLTSHGYVRAAASKYRVANGYGRPTIVFQVATVDPTGTYRVRVSGIRKPGTARAFSHQYVVSLFTPSV